MYMLKKKSLLIISAVALLGLLLSGCSADTANGKIKYDHVAMPEETDPYYIIGFADYVFIGSTLSDDSMFLGLKVESLNICEMFGFAGGVSQMIVRNDGKRVIKRISDMSFVR